MNAAPQVADATTPQQLLAAILDSHRPASLLSISQSPIPLLQDWLAAHPAEHTRLDHQDPTPELAAEARFDLAIIADQLEYMNRHAGEELIGLLRNLHTDSLIVLYQPALAPEAMRWQRTDFLAMGMRCEGRFEDQGREMLIYSYDLSDYNFRRDWNNSRFWANPENWGKYWW